VAEQANLNGGKGSSSLGDLLGIDEASFDTVDPVALARSGLRAARRVALRPTRAVPALLRFGGGVSLVGTNLATRLVGIELPRVVEPDAHDQRFADPTWHDNLGFHALVQVYLLTAQMIVELAEAARLPPPDGPKAEFAARLLGDTIAPTNALLTNPKALKRALETGGFSVLHGLVNMVRDVVGNDGWPSQVDSSPFELGRTTAATPGKVVFRNDLIEVLQYTAQTDEVFELPLLVCPPWINRYYIADLAPDKSLIEWAVRHRHTTFAVSYRNPDESMRDLTFDNYLRLGPLTAIDVAREITGSETVNTLSICLGGTMNVMVLAYLAARGEHTVNTATYLNSATDYQDAGSLATVFADPSTINSLVRKMEHTGYLDGKAMAHTFDLLRANDLVFRYVVDGWLLGRSPPAFDLLAWNADSTNMPGKVHAEFLRTMYLENALAHDRFVALGEPLIVSEIDTDSYIVAGVDDHIVPWRVSYRSTQLFKGPVRFVMTSGGHIAGIVNPPHPKARLWTNHDLPADPDAWQAHAIEHRDSWWNDWSTWIASRAGKLRVPPSLGNSGYPVLGDAPGSYVRS
jgi:polyhydroxyalkanoate synthase subunit PhaC